jgi:NADPH-dependent curcumin reductase CurA
MSSVRNRQILLTSRPQRLPSESNYAMTDAAMPTPGDGEVLARTLILSIDPAMRGWVIEAPNYSPPVPVGEVMRSFGVAQIVDSRSSSFNVGDIVAGMTGWQEYCVLNDATIQRRIDPKLAPISTALGVLGVTGLTAYLGMIEIGQPVPGATAVVSTAAGSVGSAAGQLAALKGARTVGLTGTDEKVRLCLEEFGFDACINYRTSKDLAGELAAACPDGIDIFFDSVGGEMLDAVLEQINIGARIAICGTISMVGNDIPMGRRVERKLLVQRALMKGFLASDHYDRADEIAEEMAEWVNSGQLRYREEVSPRLDDAPAALVRMLAGENLGKSIVRVWSSDDERA